MSGTAAGKNMLSRRRNASNRAADVGGVRAFDARSVTVKANACTPPLVARFMERDQMTVQELVQARRLCGACPTLRSCRIVAMDNREPISPGVVAGMTQAERRQFRAA
jgi:hypothetical protein